MYLNTKISTYMMSLMYEPYISPVFYLCQHSAVPWTECVTGCWHISVFMFVSCAHECVCVCVVRWAHRSSARHVWEGEQPCFKTICSSEYFSGSLSLWWINARHRQAAKHKLWAGLFRKNSFSFSLGQWAVFCTQGSHSFSLCPRALVMLV